jgi:hypothetical protein
MYQLGKPKVTPWLVEPDLMVAWTLKPLWMSLPEAFAS